MLAQPYARTPDLFVAITPDRADAAALARDLKALGWLGDRITAYFKTGWIVGSGKNPASSFRPPFAVPIFFDISSFPGPVRKGLPSTMPPAENFISSVRLLTSRILVRARNGADWTRLTAATHPVKHDESDLPGWQIVEYADAWAALDALEWLAAHGGWTYQPLFARKFTVRLQATPPRREVNDPLFPNQWHFNQSGINLNLGSLWDSVTGSGMNIAIVDDGLQIAHPDLVQAAWPINSLFNHNFNSGDPDDPSPTGLDSHGTSCAGLAAARGFNDIGVAGVAPEARLMGLRLIAGPATDLDEGQALAWQPPGAVVHVSSNSWGPEDSGKDPGRAGPLAQAGLSRAATRNRAGLGTVFAFAAGNGRARGDDSGYDAYSSSRFAISVAAIGREGRQSSYSENGMNVAISAFGGEFDPPAVLWTTNLAGQEALDALRQESPTSIAPIDYTDAFNGTSAAAPQISGAAALLLQRNPNLSYRDVKEILMRSAQKNVLSGSDPFVDNGGGFSFSHSFGAGLLNLTGAVSLAASWKNLGPLEDQSVNAGDLNLPIPDNDPAGATATFSFPGTPLRVESVEFTVNIRHENRGDLRFTLISPSGMQSIARPRPKDDGADFENYTFTTVRNWGTGSVGVWTLKVVDTVANGIAGTLDSASVRIFGTAPAGQKPIVSEGGIVTAQDFGGGAVLSPGGWIEIFGANLSTTTRDWTQADFQGNRAPVSLDGVRVTVDGKPAFISFVSPGQIDARVPDGVTTGIREVIVTNPQGESDPRQAPLTAARGALLAPAEFQINGRQYVAAVLPDGTYVLPAGAIPGLSSRPAHPGETITLFGAGFGPVTPATPAGTIAETAAALVNPAQFQFAGTMASTSYQGLSPGSVGLYQFNVRVPAIADSDAVPLSVLLDGNATRQTLFTAVSH